MQAVFEKVPSVDRHSFHVYSLEEGYFKSPFHYHPEAEIFHVIKGRGTLIVGNNLRSFSEGDFVIIGPNIPHVWKDEKDKGISEEEYVVKAEIIHFDPDFFGDGFLNLPENFQIKPFMEESKLGLYYHSSTKEQLAEMMDKVVKSKHLKRIIHFLDLLNLMIHSSEKTYLNLLEPQANYNMKDCERINEIYDYLLKHHQERFSLAKLAAHMAMSTTALCRYFKSVSGKSITTALNENRVNKACRLLIEDDMNAAQACYESGFNNYSFFNEQFKKIKGQTPKKYQQKTVSEKAVEGGC